MPDFDAGEKVLPPYKVIKIQAGGQTRRIGLLGLLTIDKNLYQVPCWGDEDLGMLGTLLGVLGTLAALLGTLLGLLGTSARYPEVP
eukprot:2233685-Rhodomonas_salina.1